MKDKITILTVVTYVIILSSVSILINDMREFDMEQYKAFIDWAKTADKNESWFTSENSIKWSYYFLSTAIFFFRGYLIYGFTYFFSILKEIEKEDYFSNKNIGYFKKIGNIFITYTINILVLRFLLASIGKASFNVFDEFREEFTLLIPCGLGFYLLAEIFKRAKSLKEENDLTV
ncbi:MAG: DUF2975 domain-containing protein [Cellulophaga sp.]